MVFCKICGEENCKKHSFFLGRIRKIDRFSGSSPPEVFVGKWNYPNVYVGILSPEAQGETKIMSSPKEWHSKKLDIRTITNLRQGLIYGRNKNNIKKVFSGRFLNTMQEVAMSYKSIDIEFKLKRHITRNLEKESRAPLISNAGDVEKVELIENPKIKKKVDYLVNDTDIKSSDSMIELEKGGVDSEEIVKLLSSGLLGLRKNRKLVPTRWSITAVDDTLSKKKLEDIRTFPEISEIKVFWAEYLGNHYEFLLLPDKYSFEVIEISMKNLNSWHDYEGFFQRKKYADSVTGAYYANRFALTEYLKKIKKQAKCIVFREIRPEYYSPLGVGILREISREAFNKKEENFENIESALKNINKRLRLNVSHFEKKSILLKNYKKQRRISEWI